MAISPGGRPADASPVGTPGGQQNWVDKAGGLPTYIRMVAHALMRKGMAKQHAIAAAVNRVKRWAAGMDNVRPQVQAAAAAAVAEWEAKKGMALSSSARVDVAMMLDLAVPDVWQAELEATYRPSYASLDFAREYVRDKVGKFANDQTKNRGAEQHRKAQEGDGEGPVRDRKVQPGELKTLAGIRSLIRDWTRIPIAERASLKPRVTAAAKRLGASPRLMALIAGLGDGDFKADKSEGAGVALKKNTANAWLKRAGFDLSVDDPEGQLVLELAAAVGDELADNTLVDLAGPVGDVLDLAPGDHRPPYDWKHGFIPITPAAAASKAKKGPNVGKGSTRRPRGVSVPGRTSRSSTSSRGVAGKKGRKAPAVQSAAAKAADDEKRGRGVPGAAASSQRPPGRIRNREVETADGKRYRRGDDGEWNTPSGAPVPDELAQKLDRLAGRKGPASSVRGEQRKGLREPLSTEKKIPVSEVEAGDVVVEPGRSGTKRYRIEEIHPPKSGNGDRNVRATDLETGDTHDMSLDGLRQQLVEKRRQPRQGPSETGSVVRDMEAARARRKANAGGGSHPTKADGSPDYGAMSAEQAATIRAKERGVGVGARVDMGDERATVKAVSTRGITLEFDDPDKPDRMIPTGTPGYQRIKPAEGATNWRAGWTDAQKHEWGNLYGAGREHYVERRKAGDDHATAMSAAREHGGERPQGDPSRLPAPAAGGKKPTKAQREAQAHVAGIDDHARLYSLARNGSTKQSIRNAARERMRELGVEDLSDADITALHRREREGDKLAKAELAFRSSPAGRRERAKRDAEGNARYLEGQRERRDKTPVGEMSASQLDTARAQNQGRPEPERQARFHEIEAELKRRGWTRGMSASDLYALDDKNKRHGATAIGSSRPRGGRTEPGELDTSGLAKVSDESLVRNIERYEKRAPNSDTLKALRAERDRRNKAHDDALNARTALPGEAIGRNQVGDMIRRADEAHIARKEYGKASGPALADEVAKRKLMGREMAVKKSDSQLRTMLRNHDKNPAASHEDNARARSRRGVEPDAADLARAQGIASRAGAMNPDTAKGIAQAIADGRAKGLPTVKVDVMDKIVVANTDIGRGRQLNGPAAGGRITEAGDKLELEVNGQRIGSFPNTPEGRARAERRQARELGEPVRRPGGAERPPGARLSTKDDVSLWNTGTTGSIGSVQAASDRLLADKFLERGDDGNLKVTAKGRAAGISAIAVGFKKPERSDSRIPDPKGAPTPNRITAATAGKMSDDQLERAMSRLMESGTYSGPAYALLEAELNKRDKARRAEGNGPRR